jgi:hemerythrin
VGACFFEFASTNGKGGMGMLAWEEGYKIGYPEMDAEHLILFALLNQLDININDDMAAACVSDILAALSSYIDFHFRNEEEVMRKANYPGIEGHIATHRRFVTEIDVLAQASIQCDPQKCALKIRSFVLDWLLNHILESDAEYVRHIAGQAAS